MNNKTKMLLLLPPLLILLCVIIANSIPFDQSFSESESQILDFISSDLKIAEKKITRLTRNIKGPFDFNVKQAVARNDKVTQIDYNDKSLSLVVISDNSKMAIIGGQVVKEGDSVYGLKVKKIEPERVLIKNKKAEWLYLEKTE